MRSRFKLLPFALILVTPGCEDPRDYRRDAPDIALDSAQRMILSGDADRLTDLIYAEDDAQRSLLNQAGSLLGSLQRLAESVEQNLPEEIAAFKADAKLAAEENRASSWARYLISATRPGAAPSFGVGRVNRRDLQLDTGADDTQAASGTQSPFAAPSMSESQRGVFNALAKQLFADPYGWLAEGRDKLDTVYVADDIVAITWDGRTVAPPIGLTMRLTDAGWQLSIPWHLPGLRTIKPQSENEVIVFGSILKTLENVVNDLTSDVRNGRIRNLTDLADSAVEKAALPIVMIFVAYQSLVEARGSSAGGGNG